MIFVFSNWYIKCNHQYKDTHVERDYLIENIYPLLKIHFAEQFGFDFQVVDLRWGITDEMTTKNMTYTICANEIKNCIKNSNGPCFIVWIFFYSNYLKSTYYLYLFE